ncbi:MAG TPA: amidase [Solirubrobacterales bacterium]|jgi:amidase|nr:amidase [Solirubrobacterales bacterium]
MAMGGDEIAFAGAARQAEMVRAGEISPTELVRLHLERIERLDPQLNSFRVVLAERALLEAEQAEARLKAGDERPLLGVPIALKDSVDLAGEQTTHGTDGFPDPAAADSEMVRRLREAGAIVVGKTLLPELAICGFTESATWGVSRNPWDPQRTPAGSSGGSAAAVAAGLVPIASASDGAGSIRIPAASCGLFGLKPQRGRVSLAPYLENWNGLSVNGCVSRTVLDTALWLDIVSGGSSEPGAPAAPQRPFVEAAKTPPGKLRIAYSSAPPRALAPPTVSGVVKNAVAETAELLRSLGHETAQQNPDWGGIGNNMIPRYLRGIAEDFADVPRPERLERRTQAMARLGRLIPEPVFRRAGEAREADAARVNAIFDSHDVVMTPVMGGTALPVRRFEGRGALWTLLGMSRFYPYCIPWNHLGNPSMAVPAGFAADGMPLSVQIIGRPGEEATLLSLAAQLEAERPWADKRPPIS